MSEGLYDEDGIDGPWERRMRQPIKNTLKVYGWQGWRSDLPPEPNGSRQSREICAHHSKAGVARAAGVKRPSQLFNLDETGNREEIGVAIQRPGVIFYRGLDERGGWRANEGGRR